MNATSAEFTNEFIKMILGSAIVIPIASGYWDIDWVKENTDFGIALQTMHYLFKQWVIILSHLGDSL
ncbi:MAG: hypothetical protein ACMUEM_01660 [Flavobacteriales bacterium AspAUS03]